MDIDPSGMHYAKKASASKGELRQGSIISVLRGGSVSFGIVNAFMERNGHYGVSMSLINEISSGIKMSGQNGYFPFGEITHTTHTHTVARLVLRRHNIYEARPQDIESPVTGMQIKLL